MPTLMPTLGPGVAGPAAAPATISGIPRPPFSAPKQLTKPTPAPAAAPAAKATPAAFEAGGALAAFAPAPAAKKAKAPLNPEDAATTLNKTARGMLARSIAKKRRKTLEAAAPAAAAAAAEEGGIIQTDVHTPAAEVAKLPVEPKSAEDLAKMIKDFETAIGTGRKDNDKITTEELDRLKKYNKFFPTKLISSSTVKTLKSRLMELQLEEGIKGMKSPTKAFKGSKKLPRTPPPVNAGGGSND